MKKQYINAIVIILIIILATNTDFYKKNILGIDLKKQKMNLAEKKIFEKKKDIDIEKISANKKNKKDNLLTIDSTLLDSATIDSLSKIPKVTKRVITVNTKKLKIEFSSKGAVITNLFLNEYFDKNKKELNLFNKGSINSIKVNKFEDKNIIYTLENSDSILNLDSKDSLVFTYFNDKISIKKTYIINPDSYMIDVKLSVNNNKYINSYTINWDSPIIFNDREDKNNTSIVSLINGEYEKNNGKELTSNFSNIKEFWIGYRIKYFWGSLIFDSKKDLDGKLFTKSIIAKDKKSVDGYFHTKFSILDDKDSFNTSYKIFFSPIDKKIIKNYGYNLEKVSGFGWTFIQPVSGLIMKILKIMNNYIHNWGVIIVIFSLLLKLLLYPLNKKTIESSKKMQDIQPLIKEVNKKWAKDPQRKQQEIMKLYKKHKVNPFGSCLPMILQMPIFFAMYAVFRGSIEFRQAPFFGWITDLSQPESIYQINVGSFQFHLGILVIISSLAMFLQMKRTMKDPKQKMMPYFMGIFMFFIFSNMSSGLNLYWATFNLFQLAQQILVEKKSK